MNCRMISAMLVCLFLAMDFAVSADAQVYKDQTANVEDRVRDLLSMMTLEEKVEQMIGASSGMDTAYNERLGIPELKFCDGPRGARVGNSTTFPVSIARGATWDPEIEMLVGEAMGRETIGKGRNCLLAPCLNLIVNPLGGRSQETYGEDTFHVGEISAAFVEGVQGQGAMACAKHFAVNNAENQRSIQNSVIDDRTLYEIYLPHFKACADAGVASFMCAYNRINGDYCSSSVPLMRNILKGVWDYEGFVVSDWGATTPPTEKVFLASLGMTYDTHFPFIDMSDPFVHTLVTNEPEIVEVPATENTIAAGLDVEMPSASVYGQSLMDAVNAGTVPEELVDDCVERILREKFRFGLFDETAPRFNESVIECAEHANIARMAEREAIVLLKNDGSVLPIDDDEVSSIAVIGKGANGRVLGDHGSSNAQPSYCVTVLDGIKGRAGEGIEVKYCDGSDLEEAAGVAASAGFAVIVAALTYEGNAYDNPVYEPVEGRTYEGEGNDRGVMTLPGNQVELINSVSAANHNFAVVMLGGSAVDVQDWIGGVPALLMAWYPGMEGGNAIADVLFGDYNPGGKLPLTFPKSIDQLPPFENNNLKKVYDYYHGYRYFDKYGLEPQFEFGYGLSYTTFEYSNLRLDRNEMGPEGRVIVNVDVANAGELAGDEVVQVYIGYEGSRVERAVKDLKGFKRVTLAPGEKKTVSIEIDAKNLAYYSIATVDFEVEPIEYIVQVGSSSRNIRLTDAFRITTEGAAFEEGDGKAGSDIPGFECIALVAGLAISLALIRKRK